MQLSLVKSGEQRTFQVHILVLTAFVGPRPDGMQGCHGPAGQADNRIANLRWDTPGENNRDQVSAGTHPFATRGKCKRGHRLAMPNLVASLWEKRGYRDCLACNRARTLASNRKRRTGEVIDWAELSHTYYADIMATGEVAA
jgi:hypothetical protein